MKKKKLKLESPLIVVVKVCHLCGIREFKRLY